MTRLLFTGVVLLAAMAGRGLAADPGAREGGLPLARLQTISSIAERQMTSVVIEASDPVPYLTTHPEPLTLLVDLRNVTIDGVVNRVTSPRGAIAAVAVETSESLGAPVARIRVTLTREARFRVVSNRNVIRVDVENPDAAGAASPVMMKTSVGSPSLVGRGSGLGSGEAGKEGKPSSHKAGAPAGRSAPPRAATRLHAVRAARREGAVRITVTGNGLVEPSSVERANDLPHRFVLDFKGVASIAPKVTAVGLGPVQQVRVATHSSRPLVTRLVVDLERWVEPRVERGLDGGALAIVFDESPPTSGPVNVIDAQAALKLPISDEPPKPAEPLVNGQPAPGATAPPAPREPAVTPEVLPVAGSTPAGVSQASAAASAPVPPPAAAQPAATPSPPASPPAQPPPPQPPATPPQPPPATPPATPAPGAQAGAPPQERQYTGFPISLDFENADLQAVIRVFAQETGLNVVIDPTVQGTVNVQLREVPWDQALDIILRANKLGWTLEGTIVRIAPLTVLADEEAQKAKLAQAQAEAGELQTMFRTLSYAKAAEMQALMTRGPGAAGVGMLSQRGQVMMDERTNTIIVTDLPQRLRTISDLFNTLDRPQPQVEIEARIVQTNRNFSKEIGVQWGLSGRVDPELGNTLPLTFPNQGSVSGRTGAAQGPAGTPTVVNLPSAAANTAAGLALASVNGALNLDAALSALESTGQGRLLSAPRVTTQNNVAAQMTQGVEIPIQTIANNTVTVTFRPAALSLLVTPQITAAGTVIMRVELSNESPDFSREINGIPPIDSQKALTSVLVRDGETTVIGGIYLSREQAQRDATPGLGRVPILKWLFSRESTTEENRELLVFITPRIVKTETTAAPTGPQ